MKFNLGPIKMLIAILTLITSVTSVSSQCMKQVNLNDRIDNSAMIVEGLVISERSLYDNNQNNIYTIYNLEVTRVFKGQTIDTIVSILVPGGTIGIRREEVSNNLELTPGKAGVFMLIESRKPVTSFTKLYEAYAGSQGFLKYEKNTKKAVGIFDEYQSLEQDLYRKIETRTRTSHRRLKDVPWKRVTAGNKDNSHDHDLNGMFRTKESNELYAEDVSSAIATNAVISSFSPTTVHGGSDMILTIDGSGFGAVQGTSYVLFADPNSGGSSYSAPLASQYISWSDTRIEVQVPSRAGTGLVRVTDGTTTVVSSTSLTVDYSITNISYNPGSGTQAYRAKHINDNGAGGYTFNCYTGFPTAAVADFADALNQWKCATGMNWIVGTATPINVDANDGINIVRFDIGNELSAGVLGQARSRYLGCLSGGVMNWYLDEIDVVFDDATNYTYGSTVSVGSQYDFYSVALHEMGHAHQLTHVIDNTKVMHYALANTWQRRTLASSDVAGGTYVVTHGLIVPNCSSKSSITPVSCAPAVTLSVSAATVLESGSVLITATLNGALATNVVVDLGFGGTATSGVDYNFPNSITIPAGSTSSSITFSPINDSQYEGNETVIIDITAVTNATEQGSQIVNFTIVENDLPPVVTLSTGRDSIIETGGTTAVTATLSAASAVAVTVNLGVSGTATSSVDYTMNTSIIIPAGSTSGSLALTSIDDPRYENHETIIIDIIAVTNGTESGVQKRTVIIKEDEEPPKVTLAAGARNISETGGSTSIITTLSGISDLNVIVNLSITGTATRGVDYFLATTITIPAGDISSSINLTAIADALDENDDTVKVAIYSVINGEELDEQKDSVIIVDDDATPTVSLTTGATTINETSGTTTVTATLSSLSDFSIIVNLGLSGTATRGVDYTLGNFITIPAGNNSASIILSTMHDTRDESDETVIIDISSVNNAIESVPQQRTVTIMDDDATPNVTLTTSPSSILENGSSTLTVNLSAVSDFNVTVNLGYSGTATRGVDYTGAITSVVIPAGALSSIITISSVDDAISESNETMVVDVISVVNGMESGTAQATIIINDNDTPIDVTLSVNNTSIAENGGSSIVTATLSSATNTAVVVSLGFTGTATLTSDYTLANSIIIPIGSTSASITLNAVNDVIDENNETVVVSITFVANAIENGVQQKTVTLVDDDAEPTVTLNVTPTSISETGGLSTFTATLSAVSARAVTINLGLSGTATLDADYNFGTSILIPAGSTTRTLLLATLSDVVDENNETVIVDIISVTNGTESGVQRRTVTIVDDDATPSVSLITNAISVNEAGGTVVVTANLTAVSEKTVTVNLALTGTATLNTDYTLASSITIPAGSIVGTQTLTVINDTKDEISETVIIDISSATNTVESGTQQEMVTILDDDLPAAVSLSVGASTINETSGSTTVTATLSDISDFDITVNLTTSGTATNGTDYTFGSTITIPAGSTTGTLTLASVGDAIDENDETIIIDIASVINGRESGVQRQTVTILDDDASPTVSLSVSSATIAESGGSSTIVATLSQASARNVNVIIGFTGTATGSGADYTVGTGTLTIPAGSTTVSRVLTAVDDNLNDDAETIIIDIVSVTNGVESGVQQKTITIIDDESPEIELYDGTTEIFNGDNVNFGQVIIGNSILKTFTILNSGNFELSLTDASLVTINGTNASDFMVSIVGTQSNISVGASTVFTVLYTPDCGSTNRSAAITIKNTDTDESLFVINLSGTSAETTAPVPDVTSLPTITAECSAMLIAPTATDNCDGNIIATTLDPVNYNQQGSYIVTWTYADASGNHTNQTQSVVISDITQPLIVCPSDIVQNSKVPVIVNYTSPVGTDNCGGSITSIITGLASGSVFPIGITNVSYEVSDVGGNKASCDFNVTISNPNSVVNNANLKAAIYPNPTLGTVNVELVTVVNKIIVMDDKGVIIKIIETPELNNKIDLSTYQDGLYLIQMQSDDGVINKKVTLQK